MYEVRSIEVKREGRKGIITITISEGIETKIILRQDQLIALAADTLIVAREIGGVKK